MFLNLSLSDVFVMIRKGLWILGKNTAEVKCHSHYIIAGTHETQDASDIKLDHLVKLACQVSPL